MWRQSGMPSSCPCRPMAKTQWSNAIVVSWLASSKLPNSRCCASGACRIGLTLSSKTWLPYLKMGSGLRSSTSGACTCITKRNSSWIWIVKCAQRRQISGRTFTAHSSFTFHADAKLSNTRTPMCTSNCRRPSGGWSCLPSHRQSMRSTRPSSSCITDSSSSSSRRSRLGSSTTYWSICSKSRASWRSMMTKRTLKTISMSMAIGTLSTGTSSSTLKIKGHSTRRVTWASTRTTRRMWCCRLPGSSCSLLSNMIASRPSEMTTITWASSTHHLLCCMSSSRWHHNTSS